MTVDTSVIGTGSAATDLTAAEMRPIVEDALRSIGRGTRVLAVVSDRTRDDNTPELFPLVSQTLARAGAASLDVLIAQGTHVPMNDGDSGFVLNSCCTTARSCLASISLKRQR